MPYTIRKNRGQKTYRVTLTKTGRLLARATRKPRALIAAIEISKRRRRGTKKMF